MQWWTDAQTLESDHSQEIRFIANVAARWGADQELGACCNYFEDHLRDGIAKDLRTARRPKPPSLKEQALGAVGRFNTNAHTRADEMARDFETIRRALEALPDELEGQ